MTNLADVDVLARGGQWRILLAIVVVCLVIWGIVKASGSRKPGQNTADGNRRPPYPPAANG